MITRGTNRNGLTAVKLNGWCFSVSTNLRNPTVSGNLSLEEDNKNWESLDNNNEL